ncbi:MAG: hypothetical protein AB7P37_03195 [Ramlibacter sp.]
MMPRRLLAGLVILVLAGCASQTTLQTVKVPVPVECSEPVPDRPAMPTETPAQLFTLDGHIAALQAEIDVREGYEIKLLTALVACTRPVDVRPR